MRRFDAIDSWIIFVTVASLGSMNKAAAELGIDVSSVSRKMERLEASLGYPLFVRTNRACILTPDGDHVLKEIQPQLAHFTASVDGLSRRTDSVKCLIRLSMEPGIAKPLTRWLCEFQDKYPQIAFDVTTITSPTDFRLSGWDLAIWAKQENLHFADTVDLGTMRTCICASAEYVRTRGPIRKIADLKHHRVIKNGEWVCPLVLYSPSTGEAFSYESTSNIRLDSMLAVKEAVLQGLGIAIGLPGYCCREELADGRLVELLKPVESLALPMCIVTPTHGVHTRRVDLLIDWIKNKWAEELGDECVSVNGQQLCSFG